MEVISVPNYVTRRLIRAWLNQQRYNLSRTATAADEIGIRSEFSRQLQTRIVQLGYSNSVRCDYERKGNEEVWIMKSRSLGPTSEAARRRRVQPNKAQSSNHVQLAFNSGTLLSSNRVQYTELEHSSEDEAIPVVLRSIFCTACQLRYYNFPLILLSPLFPLSGPLHHDKQSKPCSIRGQAMFTDPSAFSLAHVFFHLVRVTIFR
jgi:hypothetical protein